MSCDLEWLYLPEPIRAAKASWRQDLLEGRPAPSFRISAGESTAELWRLHLNAAGMGIVRTSMLALGMAYHATAPDFRSYGFSRSLGRSMAEWMHESPANLMLGLEYERDLEIARWCRDPTRIGIPVYKLSSNGPWYVPASEATEGLDAFFAAYEGRDLAHGEDEAIVWATFIEFLKGSVEHGGFEIS